MAHIFRFLGLLDELRRQPRAPFASLAAAAGYYDQAHLARDFRELAGQTPRQYAAEERLLDACFTVFENQQHDFPKRILYWLDEAGALHAPIEGDQDAKQQPMEWTWRRADGAAAK